MLSFAENEEKKLEKLEQEKQLFPLWLANLVIARLKGAEEPMDFEAFINECRKPTKEKGTNKQTKTKKTAEDIMAEFAPIIEADKQRGG